MTRRTMRLCIPLTLAFLVAALASAAQSLGKVFRIGYLATNAAGTRAWNALLDGLRELGYTEGRNLVFEYRFSDGNAERFPALAAELVQLQVDCILTSTTPATLAAKHATHTIPIVLAVSNDPVEAGLVASLARPGGNITGLSNRTAELNSKRLELLKEIVPSMTRVAVFWNAANPANAVAWRETQAVAGALGLRLHAQDVRGAQDLEGAFARTAQVRPDAFLVLADALMYMYQSPIVEFVTQQHLPSVFATRDWAVAGGLMSYGHNVPALFRRAATYVDKILKGTKPADLPIEQPMQFDLVINLKTAKALGLTIPPTLLFQADEVIR